MTKPGTPDKNGEVWRPVAGLEGQYSVSNLGRLRVDETGEIREGIDNGNGYRRIHLGRGGGKLSAYMHRLVAAAFIPNPSKFPVINHKNLIRSDNRVENLEWCSHSHNNRHIRHHQKAKRRAQGIRSFTDDEVRIIRDLYQRGGCTQRDLARHFGASQQVICTLVNGATYLPLNPSEATE